MTNLPSSLNDKTNGMQKVLAFGLLAAVGWGVVKLLNAVLPSINEMIKNIWTLLMYGVPLAILVLYVISNPLIIWGFFKTLSWKFTSWLIKMDPLSVMDRYVEYLGKKLRNLKGTVTVLQGKKVKLERQINALEDKCEEHIRLGKAAYKTQGKDSPAVSLYGTKLETDRSSLENIKPLYQRIDRNLTFLQKLEENWEYGIQKLTYQIEGKRSEYEIIKETTKGLKNAEDMINSDNAAARAYGMSVKALEESVTQQIGYIDEFERRSKDIMRGIDIEKQANHDEGLAELEKYLLDDNLKFSFDGTPQAQPVMVSTDGGKKFNLLNK